MEQGDVKSKKAYEKYFQWIVDCLFDRVLQYDEQDDLKQFGNCLLAIHAFTTTCPELLRETQASGLQPYLSVTNLVCFSPFTIPFVASANIMLLG